MAEDPMERLMQMDNILFALIDEPVETEGARAHEAAAARVPAPSAEAVHTSSANAKAVPTSSADAVPPSSADAVPPSSAKAVPTSSAEAVPTSSAEAVPTSSAKAVPTSSADAVPTSSAEAEPGTQRTVPKTTYGGSEEASAPGPGITLERRLSCQESERILSKMKNLALWQPDLPGNDGRYIDCRLSKSLSSQEYDKDVDDTVQKVKEWAEEMGEKLKRHGTTHRFVETREVPGRFRDSGCGSAEFPVAKPIQEECGKYEIDVLKGEETYTRERRHTSPDVSSDFSSTSCNLCLDRRVSCRCPRKS